MWGQCVNVGTVPARIVETKRRPATGILILYVIAFLAIAWTTDARAESYETDREIPSFHGLSQGDVALVARLLQTPNELVGAELEVNEQFRSGASAALAARKRRKTLGLVLTVIGGVTLVGGDLAGALVMVLTPGYPLVEDWGQYYVGLGVALVSLSVAIGLLVPGIVQLAKASPEERDFVLTYRADRRSSWLEPQRREASSSRPSIAFPLLALSF